MIENILNDPMFWKIAAVVIILIFVASFKKLFKLVLVLIVILIIYAGYLIYTGEDPEDVLESFKQTGAEAKELIEEKVKQGKKAPVKSNDKKKKKKKKKKRFQQQEDEMNELEELLSSSGGEAHELREASLRWFFTDFSF